ncbi:putative F-box protein At3g16210 [Solanum tuberosum]|uniref:putative F-box protein At3g16210 n=1 Tax=Solanum tuberosum TaxID=4113 RepID=UPI00073A0BB3|nr:PREDICTED: putative F-box protein At3g16210 [Solanum tuberosum]
MPTKKKLQKAFEDDISILPCDDILFSIMMIRLPVKSLLRFQSVSVSWKATISDKGFKRSHRDQSRALGREKLLLRQIMSYDFVFRDSESPWLVRMDEKTFFPRIEFQIPLVISSCDGLMLLKNYMASKTCALWNPSTREYRILECPYVKHNYKGKPPIACGLCYDFKVDDYKVILIYSSFYTVYSLSNNSWSNKTCVALGGLPLKMVYFGL